MGEKGRLHEQNEALISALHNYETTNKNFDRKFQEDRLSNIAILQEWHRHETQVRVFKKKNMVLKESPEEIVADAKKQKRVHSQCCDKVLISVKPEKDRTCDESVTSDRKMVYEVILSLSITKIVKYVNRKGRVKSVPKCMSWSKKDLLPY